MPLSISRYKQKLCDNDVLLLHQIAPYLMPHLCSINPGRDFATMDVMGYGWVGWFLSRYKAKSIKAKGLCQHRWNTQDWEKTSKSPNFNQPLGGTGGHSTIVVWRLHQGAQKQQPSLFPPTIRYLRNVHTHHHALTLFPMIPNHGEPGSLIAISIGRGCKAFGSTPTKSISSESSGRMPPSDQRFDTDTFIW